jgi:molybdopterin/thiamine biosynthesis adenylyltransferase
VSGATLVLSTLMAEEIAAVARENDEAAGVLLVGLARTDSGLRLLGRELHWTPDHSYARRTPDSLTINSSGYMQALSRAEVIRAVPIWLHTHPGWDAAPLRSEHDVEVDRDLKDTFRARSGSDVYASLVVSPADRLFRFSGTTLDGDLPQSVNRMLVVGPRWSLLAAEDADQEDQIPPLFDRQVRAFGGDVQRVLGQLRIGVVGCGGIGSAVSEQLIRLGVRSLLLIDPDHLTETNITRVYGSAPADVGEPKVNVLAAHLRRIAPNADVTGRAATITAEPMARELTACDVIFGCTDDNAGRLVLSRLASYYLAPVLDLGVLLSSTAGRLEGIDGRITIMTPGDACMVCRGRIDLARAQAEQLNAAEREVLQAEGYAPELGDIEPAVVPYTSLVASLAVAELLERFIGYGPDQEPGEILIRCHERELSTNTCGPRTRHYCDPGAGVLGTGDHEPFLGQTWRAG